MEVREDVMRELDEAAADLRREIEMGGPPLTVEVGAAAPGGVGAAGCAEAQHVLLDHHFTSSLRRLWVYADGAWRHRNVGVAEEQGLVQVAYAADRVDACWNDGNELTTLRCWRGF
jgi:hypothetical protein